MEHSITHLIMLLIEKKFPYHELRGSYTEEEYQKYLRMGRRIRPIMLCSVLLFMFLLVSPLYLGLNQLAITTWGLIEKDTTCIMPLSGPGLINAFIFDIGFCFPMLSILTLKLFYPHEYPRIIDFISVRDNVDINKLGKATLKWFTIAGIVFFLYDLNNCTLIRKDGIYIKEFTTMPRTLLYKDMAGITVHEVPSFYNDGTKGKPQDVYLIRLKNRQLIRMDYDFQNKKCAELLAQRAHLTIERQ